MKNRKKPSDQLEENAITIPDLTVIDLEKPSSETDSQPEESALSSAEASGLNIHIIFFITFLILVLCLIGGLIYSFLNWGRKVDPSEIFQDGPGAIDNKLDLMLPAIGKDNNPIYKEYGEGSNIVFFGNAPFADDKNSRDNLVNIIQEMTGANVYNCSVADSYLAASSDSPDLKEHPEDIFNFYWLCHIAVSDMMDQVYLDCLEILGDKAPSDAMEIYNTLNTLDFNKVDVIVIMYDASDYLAGHEMYSANNHKDLMQFTGNMEAGIEILHNTFPNIRIMVLSPSYAYGIDENGDYISSDIQRYGQDVLSTYVIMQYQSCSARSVTFVDNLYGTVTEANASEYLIDNLHLNVEGRKKIAQRFVDALNHFSKSGETE